MLDPALIAEAERRFTRQGVALAKRMEDVLARLDRRLFDKQLAFIRDPSRHKCARCTRRAGKSVLIPNYAVREAYRTGGLVRIWAITRLRVKQLHWENLKKACAAAGIEFTPNEAELTVKLENGGEIRLVGADKFSEADKKRGDATVLEIIDEAQMFGPFLEAICEDIIGPSLLDHRGTICLMGTPGINCAGYWFDISQNDAAKRKHGYSFHFWSVYDNPFMPNAREDIAALKARRGWADNHPTYLREYCGIWVNDSGALVYKYEAARNGFQKLPKEVVLEYFAAGADLGSGGTNDPMALVVWGWSSTDPRLWERFSKKYAEETTTDVMMRDFLQLREECGGFIKAVIDTGGGGKLTANDLNARHGAGFEAAQKTEKHVHQKLMNDDITSGLIKVDENGELAREWSVLPKDQEDETKEDERFPNHCSDAGLYSYRACRHFWAQPDELPPAAGTPEAEEHRADEFAAQLIEHDERVAAQEADWSSW